eukprot:651362-Pelagomonas_calceolata.AAC.1
MQDPDMFENSPCLSAMQDPDMFENFLSASAAAAYQPPEEESIQVGSCAFSPFSLSTPSSPFFAQMSCTTFCPPSGLCARHSELHLCARHSELH